MQSENGGTPKGLALIRQELQAYEREGDKMLVLKLFNRKFNGNAGDWCYLFGAGGGPRCRVVDEMIDRTSGEYALVVHVSRKSIYEWHKRTKNKLL